MKPTCFPSQLMIAFLFIFPATLAAQTYSSRAEWDAAVCGQLVEDEIVQRISESGITGAIVDLPNPTDLGWGTLTSYGFVDNRFVRIDDPAPLQAFIIEHRGLSETGTVETTFFLDPESALGSVEGFCFEYGSEGFNVDIYDGATIVESLHAPSSGTTELADFGWINVNGLNVTRVEIYSVPDVPGANTLTIISSIDFSFGEYCPPGVSLFDQLTDVRDDVAALLGDATGNDVFFLRGALATLDRIQSASFWESDNRLSQNGGNLFLGAATAIVFLQRTRNAQADSIINDLMDALRSIVDAEIAYATANGGTSNLIEQAEYFANLGDSINNPFIAALAYRQAWLNAYAATN